MTFARPLLRIAAGAAGVCALLAFTAWKGLLRQPHPWAIAQLSLNYSAGIVKRGLAGTLLLPFVSHVRPEIANLRIARFSEAVLFACLALTLALCARLLRQGWEGAAVACLFVTAPIVWTLAMCIGYLDAAVVAVGLAGVILARRSVGWLIAACAVALFVHEMAALLLVPLLLVTAIDPRAPLGIDRRRLIVAIATLLGFALVCLWLFRRLPTPELERSMRLAGVAPQHWIGVLLELMRTNLKQDWARIGSNPNLLAEYVFDSVQYLPVTVLIAALGVSRIAGQMSGRARAVAIALFLVAALSSIVMVRIAFDYARLFAVTNVEAFLAYALLVERVPPSTSRIGFRVFVALAAVVVACDLLQPAHFTFMTPQPRCWPAAADRWMLDPLGSIATRTGNALTAPPLPSPRRFRR